MVEIELKFQIEPAQRAVVKRAVLGRAAGAQTIRLQARYFDTPDQRLAAAGLALRLRREGRSRWVQTLKGRGDGLMQRLEHEVVLAPGQPATLDLARHDGTPAGTALRAALATHEGGLAQRFATDIRRTRRALRTRSAAGEAATVELAYDEGWILTGDGTGSGNASGERLRKLAVAEIDFELLGGAPQALLALASRWVQRHGLWLDVRSKAERGHGLASGALPAAVMAQPSLLGRRMSPARALAGIVQATLAQVLPNLAVVAEATQAGPEHVHQLRVGLRRLRTALREFGAGVEGVDSAWEASLAQAFGALGALRDRDVSDETLAAARAAARQAGIDPGAARAPRTAALAAEDSSALRERGLHGVLLALIGLTLAREPVAGSTALLDVARKRLSRLHKRVAADAASFAALGDGQRHSLRKRMKRLRYSLEFVAPLFPAKVLARYLKLLKPAQEALGAYNDVVVAEAACRAATPHSLGDAFVLGWLSARRDALASTAATRLTTLCAAPGFWKS